MEISLPLPILKTCPIARGYHSAHHVPDVGEAARLRPVAEHRDRPSRERLLHEVRNDHPVLARLPRADGVEQADDDDG